jgi:poly(3-hydroxybutyrate) depolymerase
LIGGSGTRTDWGAPIGAGIEVGFAPNWSVGVEYDHIFLQDRTANFTGARAASSSEAIHGDRDTTVHPINGDRIFQQSAKAKSRTTKVLRGRVPHGHAYTRIILTDAGGRAISEHWNIHGAGHAWSGGSPAGSYSDPQGPDATREMLRFFLEHSLPG